MSLTQQPAIANITPFPAYGTSIPIDQPPMAAPPPTREPTAPDLADFLPAIDGDDRTFSDQRFEQERRWHLEAAEYLLQAGFPLQAERCRGCHDPERIVAHRVCSEHPEHSIHPILYACDLPICPTCSRNRANKLVRNYSETALLYAEHGRPGFSPRHFVLTTPYTPDAPQAAQDRDASWKAVTQTLEAVLRERLRSELSPDERQKGRIHWDDHRVGYLAAAQWGDAGKLHFHLFYYGPYVDHELLRDQWNRYTHGAAHDVWMGRVEVSESDISDMIRYTGQLGMVPAVLTPQILPLLAGHRRIRSKGIFHGKKLLPQRAQHACPHCGAALIVTTTPPPPSLSARVL